MSYFLRKEEMSPEEQAAAMQPLTQKPSGASERFTAAVRQDYILRDVWQQKRAHETAVQQELLDAVGPIEDTRVAKSPVEARRNQRAQMAYIEAEAYAKVAAAREANPSAYPGLPASREEAQAEVQRRRMAELTEVNDVLGRAAEDASSLPEIAGALYAGVADPVTLATVPFGGFGRGVLRVAAREAGLSLGAEALSLPAQFRTAEELGQDTPNAAFQLGLAATFGAGLGGALEGGARALGYYRAKQTTTAQRSTADTRPLAFGREVDAAEAELTGVAPARTYTGPQQPEPANWPQIKNGIFVGESGGDYNALFGYQNRAGGKFESVRLTEMTVDEAIAFSSPRGAYGQWVKGQIGRVATPMGAYQIVGTTLRAAKKGLRLRGDEVMTEALQDQLGIWIYRRQGTGAWEGYRGPRANPPAKISDDAPAPEFTGYTTSRGYTANGTVTAGEDFRVNVDYQVVDLGSLTRASGDLQPRDRSRVSSDEQIAEIAAGLDPARLMPSPEADRGAPIVGPDNIIESGNGRIMGIERAYREFPDRATAYRDQIAAAGYTIPEGIEQPVLVARRTSELSQSQRQDFVRKANYSATARMSATERAAMDARNLDADTVALFDPAQPLGSNANTPFTQRVLNTLPQSERNALVGPSGRLNAEGVTRVRQAMFARAFDAPDILSRYAEADAGPLRGLIDALEGAAPSWAGMRAAVQDGRLREDVDVTPFLLDAMRLIADARHIATRENKASADMVEELLADVDLLEGAVAPLTAALVRKLYPDGRALPAPKVTAFLDRYAAEAQKVGKTDASLFDDAVGTLDILQRLDGATFGRVTETGQARIPDRGRQASEMPTDAIPENAFADAATSPDLIEADDRLDETLRGLIDDLQVDGDLQIPLSDGTTFTTRQVLDDLEQDEVLDTVIDLCTAKGAA